MRGSYFHAVSIEIIMKTIPYMGSKRKLLPFLKNSMLDYLGDTEIHSFFDAFAGSGRVSHHFRNKYKK